jgi:hypothetical protein
MSDLKVPEWDELNWDQPAPTVSLPQSWDAEHSIAAELADRECARLIVNALHTPPITDAEIERHARQHRLLFEDAGIQVRRARRG